MSFLFYQTKNLSKVIAALKNILGCGLKLLITNIFIEKSASPAGKPPPSPATAKTPAEKEDLSFGSYLPSTAVSRPSRSRLDSDHQKIHVFINQLLIHNLSQNMLG